ncbi:hypothetical protein BKA63DRAFT_179364 [Paraphoma chrysanthemicola]|nr:hypothetical protein BKA63DRAFT_179364 [Paraphoma chrysanthemicola]
MQLASRTTVHKYCLVEFAAHVSFPIAVYNPLSTPLFLTNHLISHQTQFLHKSTPFTKMSSLTPNLTSLGHHTATHLLTTFRLALYHCRAIKQNRAAFTKTTFATIAEDLSHPLHPSFELCVYKYMSLFEMLGVKLPNLWQLHSHVLASQFPVIHDWVMDIEGKQKGEQRNKKKDMRNMIAHNFQTGDFFRDEEGYLGEEQEQDRLADESMAFRPGKFWNLLEKVIEPLISDLEYAVKVFEEERAKMPIKLGWKKEVEDWSAPVDPECWGKDDVFLAPEGAGGEDVVEPWNLRLRDEDANDAAQPWNLRVHEQEANDEPHLCEVFAHDQEDDNIPQLSDLRMHEDKVHSKFHPWDFHAQQQEEKDGLEPWDLCVQNDDEEHDADEDIDEDDEELELQSCNLRVQAEDDQETAQLWTSYTQEENDKDEFRLRVLRVKEPEAQDEGYESVDSFVAHEELDTGTLFNVMDVEVP